MNALSTCFRLGPLLLSHVRLDFFRLTGSSELTLDPFITFMIDLVLLVVHILCSSPVSNPPLLQNHEDIVRRGEQIIIEGDFKAGHTGWRYVDGNPSGKNMKSLINVNRWWFLTDLDKEQRLGKMQNKRLYYRCYIYHHICKSGLVRASPFCA